jgi:alkanesulfonate monooxygenase SsuD/methylene tetrahydromethanopterin reductase-like flavin-dependent oxidoreductase (luciferase family)
MKFGLMYEIQIPGPHYPGIVKDTYNQVMAQVILAEEIGFEHFWTVEHHFLTEFSYCPAPEVLYGAVSQRTSKIRIGHAVALLPPQYNHPIRVAERAAVLDILSDGRVDLGTGRSTTLIEMGGFGIDPEQTRAMWEEALSIIPRMWLEDPFSHEGHYFKIPPRSVIPKPVQQPHPPLWMACSQPDSFTIAGRKGIGALCFNIGQPEELQRRVQLYREGIRRAEPVGAFITNQVAALGLIHCAETDQRAREIGGPAGVWMLNKSLELYRPWQEQGATIPDSYKFAVSAVQGERTGRSLDELIEGGTFCLGNPDTCIRILKKFQAAGVDQVLCFMQFGGIPHQHIMDSIRLFGKYVIPYFQP